MYNILTIFYDSRVKVRLELKHKFVGKIALTVILLGAIMCQGCSAGDRGGNSVTVPDIIGKKNLESMLEEPEIAYEKEPMKPLILVDLEGYETEGDKIAVMHGSSLSQEFGLYDATTNLRVFSGKVVGKNVEPSDTLSYGIADFSDFTVPGIYYVYSDILGRSKTFAIHEETRNSDTREAFLGIHARRNTLAPTAYTLETDTNVTISNAGGWITGEPKNQDVTDGCLTALDMMMAYEYHPSVFTDDFGIDESNNSIPDVLDEIVYEINWLIGMQNPETGGVYTGIYVPEESETPVVGGETTKATAYFCATLARFSHIIKKFNPTLAQTCIQKATLAYKCLDNNKEIVTKEQMYRAGVEMFRSTGQIAYSVHINEYLSENAGNGFETRSSLDSALSYMATSGSVDKNYCSLLMADFMAMTEDKVSSAKTAGYLVPPEETVSALLRNVSELVMADYIIRNQEYGNLEQDYLHYLRGRNNDSINYVKELAAPDDYAMLLILTSKLEDDLQR